MRVRLTALPIEGNDKSGAIKAVFATIPREDQLELIATLQPKAVRLPWLEPSDAAKVVGILDDLNRVQFGNRSLISSGPGELWGRQSA
jgi:hypothetical protein